MTSVFSGLIQGIKNLAGKIGDLGKSIFILIGAGVGLIILITLIILVAKSRKENQGYRTAYRERSEPLFSINLEEIKKVIFNRITLVITGIVLVLAAITALALATPVFSTLAGLITSLFSAIGKINISFGRNTLVLIAAGIGILVVAGLIIFIAKFLRKSATTSSYMGRTISFDRLKMLLFNKTVLIIFTIVLVLAAITALALTTPIFSSLVSQIKSLLQNITFGKNTLLFAGIGIGLIIVMVLVILILRSGKTTSNSRNIYERWQTRSFY